MRLRLRQQVLLVPLMATAVAASACAGAAPRRAVPPPPPPVARPLDWRLCTAAAGPVGDQCATLSVPLDYTDPGGRHITLALDRLPATGHPIGAVVVNPGGPGESGVDYLPALAGEAPADLRRLFDLVSWDPRGVGRSSPVHCGDDATAERFADLDPAPVNPTGVVALEAGDRLFGRDCQRSDAALLAHVGTLDTVRDLEEIRRALGGRLTYLGISYGTVLGAQYLARYPGRVRAMVLDGAFDPARAPLTASVEQAVAQHAALGRLAASCRADPKCPWHPGPSPDAALTALLAALRRSPLPAGGGRSAGPAELVNAVFDAIYAPAGWRYLDDALSGAAHGSGAGLTALSDEEVGRSEYGHYSTLLGSNAAIACRDNATAAPNILDAAKAAEAQASFFGLPTLYANLLCANWPVNGQLPVGAVSAAGAPPALVVGSTGDPYTPYAWAVSLARELHNSTLLTRDGDGHTAYRFSACVRIAVDAYLETLRPPPAGTVCPTGG